jgi:glycosyltransferase involved in cell wall biosynthesis
MKILLHDNSLNVRGSTAAIYDYATFLEKSSKDIKCYIAHDKNNSTNDTRIIKNFQEKFDVLSYDIFNEVDPFIRENKIDYFYIIKAGGQDGKISAEVPNLIHAVFPVGKEDIHGDKYAFVSEWLADDFKERTTIEKPFIPHMINLPKVEEDLRARLNIDKDQIVIGRFGGMDSFDIQFVYDAVVGLVQQRKDITFLFCNTYPFFSHPNIIFTNSFATQTDKVKFINTCDALLHARHRGETFGLTILEYMSRGKPIFTYGLSPEKNHYSLLANQGIIYNDREQVVTSIINFKKHNVKYTKLSDFTPDKVIKKFKRVYNLSD